MQSLPLPRAGQGPCQRRKMTVFLVGLRSVSDSSRLENSKRGGVAIKTKKVFPFRNVLRLWKYIVYVACPKPMGKRSFGTSVPVLTGEPPAPIPTGAPRRRSATSRWCLERSVLPLGVLRMPAPVCFTQSFFSLGREVWTVFTPTDVGNVTKGWGGGGSVHPNSVTFVKLQGGVLFEQSLVLPGMEGNRLSLDKLALHLSCHYHRVVCFMCDGGIPPLPLPPTSPHPFLAMSLTCGAHPGGLFVKRTVNARLGGQVGRCMEFLRSSPSAWRFLPRIKLFHLMGGWEPQSKVRQHTLPPSCQKRKP